MRHSEMPAAHCAHGFWPQNHVKRKKASRNYVAGWITKQAKHWETLFKYASNMSNAFSCANMMPAVAICVPFSCHNLTRICSHLQSIERATDCHFMSMSLAENLTISWKIFSWAYGESGFWGSWPIDIHLSTWRQFGWPWFGVAI